MQDGENVKPQAYEVSELDEKALETVTGGDLAEELMRDTNVINCDNNTNCAGGNCVAGCT